MFDPQDEAEILKRLSAVIHDVKLVLFTQSLNCETCPEAEALIGALAKLSDKLKLETYNIYVDREKAELYRIERAPALIVEGERDYGIRYLGVPGGYEFASLLEDVIAVGRRESGLSEESREKIRSLKEPLNLKVFVTPT
jgi:glutaredoxin-like protein